MIPVNHRTIGQATLTGNSFPWLYAEAETSTSSSRSTLAGAQQKRRRHGARKVMGQRFPDEVMFFFVF
jgi:hypothetical protein